MEKIGKTVLCFITLIIMMFAVNRIMYQIDRNLENYNNMYVHETKGIVTSALYMHNPEGDETSITIKTDDEKMVKLSQEGNVKYEPLEEITVFTDEINYALTSEEIVPSWKTQLDLYFITLIPLGVLLYIWWRCFKWKGLILSILFISMTMCW